LEQVTWTPRLVLETQLLMETWLVLKHCHVRPMDNIIYRKTSNTSPRLLLEQVTWLVLETWLLMETWLVLKHCQLAILNFLCVHGILDFKYETQQTNMLTFHFVETVHLLGLLPKMAPGRPPGCIGDLACNGDLAFIGPPACIGDLACNGTSDVDPSPPICIPDPASIWNPACIKSFMICKNYLSKTEWLWSQFFHFQFGLCIV